MSGATGNQGGTRNYQEGLDYGGGGGKSSLLPSFSSVHPSVHLHICFQQSDQAITLPPPPLPGCRAKTKGPSSPSPTDSRLKKRVSGSFQLIFLLLSIHSQRSLHKPRISSDPSLFRKYFLIKRVSKATAETLSGIQLPSMRSRSCYYSEDCRMQLRKPVTVTPEIICPPLDTRLKTSHIADNPKTS